MARNINSRSRLSWSVYPVGGIRNRGDQNSSKLSLQALASKTHFCMEEIFHFLFRFFSTYPHVNFFWFIAWVAGCITFCVVLHCVLRLHWAVPEKAFRLLNCINIWQNTKYLLKSNVQVQWKMNYTCRNKKGWNRIKKMVCHIQMVSYKLSSILFNTRRAILLFIFCHGLIYEVLGWQSDT